MNDSLTDGRKALMFKVKDDFQREAKAVEPGLSCLATRVTSVPIKLEEEIVPLTVIRVYNSPS